MNRLAKGAWDIFMEHAGDCGRCASAWRVGDRSQSCDEGLVLITTWERALDEDWHRETSA